MNGTMAQERIIRRRIAESFQKSSEQIDREVAEAFLARQEFRRHFTESELTVVFANIFHTLIEQQKFAGVSVPLTHNVAQMDVAIHDSHITVNSLLHIHSPIRAFITFDYDLMTDPARPGRLTLRPGSLKVTEKTSRFDFFAKTVLLGIDIRGIVEDELQDPARVIRKTLPRRLRTFGFDGEIRDVHLEITPERRLHTCLIVGDAMGDKDV